MRTDRGAPACIDASPRTAPDLVCSPPAVNPFSTKNNPTLSTVNMATSRDAPNPLRPYYIPPSIGIPVDVPQNQTSAAPHASRYSSKPSLGSQARDILSDLDYDSYFPDTSPTVAGHAKRLLDQALWNYTSVLLAQPFEVAKTILQIHEARGELPALNRLKTEEWGNRSRPDSFHSGKYEDVSVP